MKKTKLHNARVKLGLSQQEMSVLASMEQTTYGRKENGISKITTLEWKKFALILDVDLNEIFESDGTVDNSIGTEVHGTRPDTIHFRFPEQNFESLKNILSFWKRQIKR